LSPGLYYWPSDVYGDVLGRGTWGQVTRTERKIMSYSFWIIALILVHVAFLFMVPWE
jgi:hypothetical protein